MTGALWAAPLWRGRIRNISRAVLLPENTRAAKHPQRQSAGRPTAAPLRPALARTRERRNAARDAAPRHLGTSRRSGTCFDARAADVVKAATRGRGNIQASTVETPARASCYRLLGSGSAVNLGFRREKRKLVHGFHDGRSPARRAREQRSTRVARQAKRIEKWGVALRSAKVRGPHPNRARVTSPSLERAPTGSMSQPFDCAPPSASRLASRAELTAPSGGVEPQPSRAVLPLSSCEPLPLDR